MKLKYTATEYVEERRIDAWHATFNAVLTGLLASGRVGTLVSEAKLVADNVHGSIEVSPPTE